MKITHNELPKLIGFAGTFASGKDTIAEYLADNENFLHISTGDIVREIAREKYGSIERPVLRKTADELRHEKGAGALVDEAVSRNKQADKIAISGIRALGEAKALKRAGGILVFVDADPRIRYERMKNRQRDNETQLTFEEFLINEEKEMESGKSDADFNIRAISEMADIFVENNKTLKKFIANSLKKIANFTEKAQK